MHFTYISSLNSHKNSTAKCTSPCFTKVKIKIQMWSNFQKDVACIFTALSKFKFEIEIIRCSAFLTFRAVIHSKKYISHCDLFHTCYLKKCFTKNCWLLPWMICFDTFLCYFFLILFTYFWFYATTLIDIELFSQPTFGFWPHILITYLSDHFII